MSSLIKLLSSQLGADALRQVSTRIGSDEQTTSRALSEALPVLLGAIAQNSGRQEGAQALSNALDKDHDGSILNDLTGFIGNAQAGPGDGILRHVLGSKRPMVEATLSQSTGMAGNQVSQMLTMLAPLIMGSLGQVKRRDNLDSNGLASLLKSERQAVESQSPQAMGLISKLLDTDADGDVDIKDIARRGTGILGKLFGRR